MYLSFIIVYSFSNYKFLRHIIFDLQHNIKQINGRLRRKGISWENIELI